MSRSPPRLRCLSAVPLHFGAGCAGEAITDAGGLSGQADAQTLPGIDASDGGDDGAQTDATTSCAKGCMIERICHTAGISVENVCLRGDPAISPAAWTDNDGVACEDGLFCTRGDKCPCVSRQERGSRSGYTYVVASHRVPDGDGKARRQPRRAPFPPSSHHGDRRPRYSEPPTVRRNSAPPTLKDSYGRSS